MYNHSIARCCVKFDMIVIKIIKIFCYVMLLYFVVTDKYAVLSPCNVALLVLFTFVFAYTCSLQFLVFERCAFN